jgi:NAD(P)-dependent dehydrogenase (short-subunit alcohol dehydrogenase family)
MDRANGRTALVTGSSRGIGRATAAKLGREGVLVAVHYAENQTAAEETVTLIEKTADAPSPSRPRSAFPATSKSCSSASNAACGNGQAPPRSTSSSTTLPRSPRAVSHRRT